MALCRNTLCMGPVLADGWSCGRCLAAIDLRDENGLRLLGRAQLHLVAGNDIHPLQAAARALLAARGDPYDGHDADAGCPVCYAAPGDACTTPHGIPRDDHRRRQRA